VLSISFTNALGGSCTYDISPTSATFSVNGGSGSIAVDTLSGCAWAATSSRSWLIITSGASGLGDGVVCYVVASNPGNDPRFGNIRIGDKSLTVSQEGQLIFADGFDSGDTDAWSVTEQ
jgi:hypothetical protein